MDTFRLFSVVRVVRLLHSADTYDGWNLNQRPPRIGDIGTVVDIMTVPGKPMCYVVEACFDEGVPLWLGDFERQELELVNAV